MVLLVSARAMPAVGSSSSKRRGSCTRAHRHFQPALVTARQAGRVHVVLFGHADVFQHLHGFGCQLLFRAN